MVPTPSDPLPSAPPSSTPAAASVPALVRPFRRGDRDQLAGLVNAHVQAVVPGLSLSVNAVLGSLERETGEFIVDPWVTERLTLVAEQRGRITAAAHLLRYGDGPEVGESYRAVGEVRWLLCWPDAPYWPDAVRSADAAARAAVAWLSATRPSRIVADGTLPAPGVFGVTDQWPHVRGILERAGFRSGGRLETVHLADVRFIPRPGPPIPGLTIERTLGVSGTRLSGIRDGAVVGFVEVELLQGDTGRVARHDGWADVGNLHVVDAHRRQGVGRWLLGQAADWLDWAHVDRLLDYSLPEESARQAFLRDVGFTELTTTRRDWVLASPSPGR